MYRKVPKFLDTIKLRCNLPKTKQRGLTLGYFVKKDANGIANSEDPESDLGLHCLPRPICPNI